MRSTVPATETAIDPAQPRRFEKNTNMPAGNADSVPRDGHRHADAEIARRLRADVLRHRGAVPIELAPIVLAVRVDAIQDVAVGVASEHDRPTGVRVFRHGGKERG